MKKHFSKIVAFFMLSLSCFYADAQNAFDTVVLKKFGRVEIDTSLANADTKWIPRTLQKNLNPQVPVANGAPIGKYTVVVQFVLARDNTVSDIRALTNHGYGMEQELVRGLKKRQDGHQRGKTKK